MDTQDDDMHGYLCTRQMHGSLYCFFAYVQVRAAHVAHVKLKTMRHPNILKYIDGVEVWYIYTYLCACTHCSETSSYVGIILVHPWIMIDRPV